MNRTVIDARIGWVLSGNEKLASSRLQGTRVQQYLASRGVPAEIAALDAGELTNTYTSEFFRLAHRLLKARYDAVFFQKPSWMMFKLSEMLRLNGVRTAAIQCDPFPGDYHAYFDRVVVTTERLREILKLPDARVIDDMLEVPQTIQKIDYESASDKVRLVWVGQGMPTFVQNFFTQLAAHPLLSGQVEVVTIGRGTWVTRQWTLETVYDDILACDIAVIPLPESDWASAKSTNRLTQFMAMGMPTVASPIDSYRKIFSDQGTFVLARTIDDFAQAIHRLRDASARREMGLTARAFAWAHYAPDTIGPLWLTEVEQLLQARPSGRAPKLHTQVMGRFMGALSRLG